MAIGIVPAISLFLLKILIICYMGLFFSFLFENYVWGHKTNSLIPQNKKSVKNFLSFLTFKNHMS